jgi:outer membrane protein assembly factor BamB
VYIGSFDKKLYAFSASGCGQSACSPLWTGLTGDFIDSSPSVANGVVYVGSNNLLYAFKANGCGSSTCSPLWIGQANGQQGAILSAPAIANGLVYVSENNGMVMVFNAKGCGQPLCLPVNQLLTHNEPIVSSSPAVVNGTVYVGSADQLSAPVGRLYVFKSQ